MLEEHRLSSFILDAEIVAIDPVTGTLKTFQELSGRARKEVLLSEVKVPVCVFAFDLMYLNGEVSQPHDQSVAECCAHEHFSKPMLSKTFRERRQSLRSSFNPRRVQRSAEPIAQFDFVESCESENSDVSIEEFMAQAVEQKCEGLMIKVLQDFLIHGWVLLTLYLAAGQGKSFRDGREETSKSTKGFAVNL